MHMCACVYSVSLHCILNGWPSGKRDRVESPFIRGRRPDLPIARHLRRFPSLAGLLRCVFLRAVTRAVDNCCLRSGACDVLLAYKSAAYTAHIGSGISRCAAHSHCLAGGTPKVILERSLYSTRRDATRSPFIDVGDVPTRDLLPSLFLPESISPRGVIDPSAVLLYSLAFVPRKRSCSHLIYVIPKTNKTLCARLAGRWTAGEEHRLDLRVELSTGPSAAKVSRQMLIWY